MTVAYFPFFVDIEGKRCLIAGGGTVACRKALTLMDYGPDIVIVAPRVIPEMERLIKESGGKITWRCREFEDTDLETMDFVIAATSDEEVNRRISIWCRERKIPVNVADMQEECSFIFPALIKEGDITVGISTGGSSPALARYIKKQLIEAIPKGLGSLAQQLGLYRDMVREKVDSLSVRRSIFRAMTEEGIRQGEFTREQAEELIERKLAEHEK
ncbi:precorrin-2 dehydrogenase/sirohydrochlorin ferrochelatase family protein [Lacrimispora sp.]|jgi:precorrin-2 dehydrogenase/sirohydrochlorin ferrochelatase|uniref:precorrin-2 dehydrogenase/sirohydrochlorin ferrochelatase family protein n=1 Tax=Lacrimispora sp. TaxID=2719234 RepID=UPI00289D1E4B|nr:bifunctional precorrin-2 dehydrogenase/sirohydrochlorin ferrochelatase [Lacrimispora sp.]